MKKFELEKVNKDYEEFNNEIQELTGMIKSYFILHEDFSHIKIVQIDNLEKTILGRLIELNKDIKNICIEYEQ